MYLVCQVIQTQFNGGSPTTDGQQDARFTYFSTSVAGAGDVTAAQSEAAVALAGQAGKYPYTSVFYLGYLVVKEWEICFVTSQ